MRCLFEPRIRRLCSIDGIVEPKVTEEAKRVGPTTPGST